jgi:methionyl-tRNA formyltransferase
VKLWRTRVAADGLSTAPGSACGAIVIAGERILVACGSGSLELLEVQPESRKRMSARDWAHGMRLKPGALLGSTGG